MTPQHETCQACLHWDLLDMGWGICKAARGHPTAPFEAVGEDEGPAELRTTATFACNQQEPIQGAWAKPKRDRKRG